ncbi:MAG: hypothetical protein QM755_09580 [Luteolibacter sp.]
MIPHEKRDQQAIVSQTKAPFYPDRLPVDTDNDLLILNSSLMPAMGGVTHLIGVVMKLKEQLDLISCWARLPAMGAPKRAEFAQS